MTQGFYTGLSGLTSHQMAIDVTADNLASINTIGFKAYSTEFSTIFDDVLGHYDNASSLSDTIGAGSLVSAISMNEKQGMLMLTDSSSDLAIDGDGWFGVLNADGEVLYTRAGSFTIDGSYSVVTRNEGMYVLGTLGNNIQNDVLVEELESVPLTTVGSQQRIQLSKDLYYPSEPTSNVTFDGNLGVEDEVRSISSKIISANDEIRELKLIFSQSATQPQEGILWDVTATIQSLDGTEIFSETEAEVLFDANGALIDNTLTSVDNEGITIAIDMGERYSGLTSLANEAVTAASYSDGVEHGDLLGYTIGGDGHVEASFSNGRSSAVANIALYHFMNDQGLARVSGTHFSQSSNSGAPIFYTDNNGNVVLGATILSNKLEASNVQMEVGMTELIILQKAYAANAKTVTTSDEMIQKALNMGA